MVVSKDAKRKRKETPVVETSPEVPKRTKVQAQRKFAQGQGTSSSYAVPSAASTAATASSSQPGTPVKEGKEPPELITHKRPRTEDFLTFLCYRGTPVLPTHLDFLNQNKNNKSDESAVAEGAGPQTASEGKDDGGKTESKLSTIKSEENGTTTKKDGKSEIIPFAVRKRADQVAEGNRLRDRLKKEESNRRSPRTRLSNKLDTDTECNALNVTPEPAHDEADNDVASKVSDTKKDTKPTPVKGKRRSAKQTLEAENAENIDKKSINEETSEKNISVENKVEDKTNSKNTETSTTNTEVKKVGRGRKKAVENTQTENVGRMTRQRAFFEPVKVPVKEPVVEETILETEKPVDDDSKVEENSEFSSDDEQPLAKTMKIGKDKGRRKSVKKPQKLPKAVSPEVEIKQTTPTPVSSQNIQKVPRGRKPKKKPEPIPETASHKSDVSSKLSGKDSKKTPNKRHKDTDNRSEAEDSIGSPPKSKTEKKLIENDQHSQKSHTDHSETEVKVGRPTRKTKEAAAIYMELIGQKLSLEEFEDDDESIDSFPELPNAKKTEKMENELKLKVGQKAKPAKQNVGRKKKKDTSEVVQSKFHMVDQKFQNQTDSKNDLSKTVDFKDIKNNEKNTGQKDTQKKKSIADTSGKDGSKVKLEKSFDDSDDEPLATKIVKPPNEGLNKAANPELKLESNTDVKDFPTPSIIIEEKPPVPPVQLPIVEQPRPFTDHKSIQRISSPSKFQSVKQTTRILNPIPKPSSPTVLPSPSIERFPSPKVNPTFLTPKFDRSIERRVPLDPIVPPSPLARSILTPSSSLRADITGASTTSPLNSSNNSKKFEPDSFLAANLMPSKEESGKIFGIASVSLAQSSGPDNTKCTLGKCGSVHKPVLGPVVPTEAYLGEQLSSKDRRKAKVNMTHEQIQKWLTECSSNPDEIHDDLDDDFDDNLKPMTFDPSPTMMREERDLTSVTSKASKETNKSDNTWSGKGPSVKAQPSVVKDDLKALEKSSSNDIKDTGEIEKMSLEKASTRKTQDKLNKIDKDESTIESGKGSQIQSKLANDFVKSPKPSTSSTATSSPKHQKSPRATNNAQSTKNQSTKTTPQKNQNQQTKPQSPTKGPKRQPVYTAKLSETLKKKTTATNSFSAFSPENETSVYSFDKEDDVIPPLAKPFRRHSRRESNTEENSQSEKPTKTEKQDKSEKTPQKESQTNNSISLTLSPEDNGKSVKVCLDGTEKIDEKMSSKVEKPSKADTAAIGDSDSECHTFYIPLQGTGATGNVDGKSSDVIQGVAVKLGREGPEGPNQRVVMHATLVTKAQMGANTTPLPESMNVHEIVKNLLSSNKEVNPSGSTTSTNAPPSNAGSKSVPVGTVQPRFKSNTDTQNACGSGLTRVNSNSSLFSGSIKSRATSGKKVKDVTPIKMCNNTVFPRRDDPSQMVEAPVFRPTEKEFSDPMEFIERITPIAARFGICKIIPPDSFKPECRVSDDMRFTAYNQYIHKMLHRWGPNAKEMSAIRKYLSTQSIAMAHPPWIGGMEIDLPRLYHTVQELGGLKEVIEKKKWARVAEEMCIPKLAQDRATKLDDIYCKYLLPYDTLSPAERQKLFDEVEADWLKKESRARRNADRFVNPESVSNEEDDASTEDEEESEEENDGVSMECIVKGRSMPLNQFFRIARNTVAMWFKNTEPSVTEIEAEFWRLVSTRDSHVCVNSGSIDSSGWGYGFPTPGPKTKGSPCARHPWNLKILTNNSGSVLRSLGPVMGVTVPTLHVGMLFSCCCWYRDPHGLSWIEYLHTGANKIWYGIPDEQSLNFRSTLTSLIPTHCQNKTIWLPCDTAMVPPHLLTDRGVSLCRTVQKPGEFVVMFPRAYTSSMATGYVVSESVYFATSSWLDSAKEDFKDIHDSCEPAMFSLEQLLFAIASDQRVTTEILSQILPMINEVYDKEVAARQQLKAAGVTMTEKIPQPGSNKTKKYQTSEEYECDLCRANLYISMVKTEEGNIYCLQHALKNINNSNVQAKQCKLIFAYNIEDIDNLLKKLKDRLSQQKRKGSSSSSKKNQQK